MGKLSKEDIILNILSIYHNDPTQRAVTPISCTYNTSEGKHCAVGHCLKSEFKKKGKNWEYNSNTAVNDLFGLFGNDSFLSPKYRGHEIRFWMKFQELHDINTYWYPQGLSDIGKSRLLRLCANYQIDTTKIKKYFNIPKTLKR